MTAIFISHSSKDNEVAAALKAWLEDQGHTSLFLDFDPEAGIKAGTAWEQVLYHNLRRCQAVIALLSPHWLTSKWCFAEIVQARAQGKPVFPVRIAACDGGVLSDRQHIDLTVTPQEGYRRLAIGLKEQGLDPAAIFDWDPNRPPYPGLHAFDEADAAVFFGRTDEIARARDTLDRLRRLGREAPGFVLVLGASGSGKSSLIRAGLIPRLRKNADHWLPVRPFRPRDTPLEALALALAETFEIHQRPRGWQEILSLLDAAADRTPPDGRALIELAHDVQIAAGRRGATLLLCLDQAEELFAQSPECEATRFLALLRAALECANGQFMVLATLRSDFLGRFQIHPVLNDSTYDHDFTYETLPVGPMPARQVPEVIVGPAKIHGLEMEPGLIETMVRDMETEDALPLLAYTLRSLWERYGGDGRLEIREYEALGRLEGSIRTAAEQVLKDARPTNDQLAALRSAFVPALVRLGETGQYVRRRAVRDELLRGAESLLNRFVTARLLVTDCDQQGRETIEVAHEALLRTWPQLAGWLAEDRDKLRLTETLRRAAEEWNDRGRHDDLLVHRDGRLQEIQDLAQDQRFALADRSLEKAYLEASIALAEREAAARKAAQFAEFSLQQQTAISQSLRLAVTARGLVARSPETALLIAGEAIRLHHNAITDEVLREAVEVIPAEVVGLGGGIVHAAFVQGGEILTLSADSEVRHFDGDGLPLGGFRIEGEKLVGGALSPDGNVILAIGADGKGHLVDRRGADRVELPTWTALSKYSTPISVRWSPAGDAILATDEDAAWIWDLADRQVRAPWDHREAHHAALLQWAEIRHQGGDAPAVLDRIQRLEETGHVKRVFDAAFSPDGLRIATASDDSTIKLWDREGRHLATLQETEMRPAIALAFTPAGLVTGHMDRMARLWDANGALVARLEGHQADVRSILASPTGDGFATAVNGGGKRDGRICLWNPDGSCRQVLEGHTNWVGALAFSRDGRLLASGSWDKTIRVWAQDGTSLILQGHADPVVQVAFDESGTRLLSRARDGEARLWHWHPAPPGLVTRSDEIVAAATYWGGDTLVVSSTFDGTTRITRRSDGATCAVLPGMSALRPGSEQTMITGDRVWSVKTESYIGSLGESARIHCAVRDAEGAIARGPSFDVSAADEGDEFKAFIFSPWGDTLLIRRARTAELISVADGRSSRLDGPNYNEDEAPSVDHAAFGGDGQHVVTASLNGSLWLWRSTGEFLGGRLIDASGRWDNLYSVALSPDGGTLLTTIRGQADLWDLSLAHLVTLPCRTNKVKRGLFSPDGSRILTIGEASIPDMRLWDRNGNLVVVLPFDQRYDTEKVAFAPEAPLIVWPRKQTLHVYDLDGRQLARLATPLDGDIRVFAFDPAGTRVAVGSYGSDIQIWSLEGNGLLLATLMGHTKEINSLQFSRDGRRLPTSSSDGTVREFIIDLEALIADAARRVPRTLTEEEVDRYVIPLPLRFGPAACRAGWA